MIAFSRCCRLMLRFLLACLAFCCVAAQARDRASGDASAWTPAEPAPQLQLPNEAEIAGQRANLQECIGAVRRHLEGERHGTSWVVYLKLDELAEALQQNPQLNDALDRQMRKTLSPLIGTQPGLEQPSLMELRVALRRTLQMSRAVRDQQLLQEVFAQRVDQAQQALGQLDRAWDRSTAEQLSRDIAWLNYYGQAPQWIASVRGRFQHPNLLVNLSSDTLRRLTAKPVNEVKPIEDESDGAQVRGQATLKGSVHLAPISGAFPGQCQLVFAGHVETALHGVKGPIAFDLAGSTRLTAQKGVVLNQEGFAVLPTQTQAHTDLTTRQICTRFRRLLGKLVLRVARKQIAKQRPQASRDLSEQAAAGFREDFDVQAVQELADGQRELFSNLDRLELDRQRPQFHTNPRRLQLRLALDGGGGLTGAPPAKLDESSADIDLLLSETLVNRLATQWWSGEKLDLLQVFQSLGTPAASVNDSNATSTSATGSSSGVEKFDIQFAEHDPVTADFHDDRISFTVHGTNYVIDNDVMLTAMAFQISYRVVREPGGIALVLEGPPEITAADDGDADAFAAQQPVLRRKLLQQLRERIPLEPLDLLIVGDTLGKLNVTRFDPADGWLRAALQSAPKGGETR